MFKVLLLNDDYTPMDFVVLVLQKIFALSRERATQIMLKVHREGMGICGIYPKDVAATKVEQVRSYAKQQHLLGKEPRVDGERAFDDRELVGAVRIDREVRQRRVPRTTRHVGKRISCSTPLTTTLSPT